MLTDVVQHFFVIFGIAKTCCFLLELNQTTGAINYSPSECHKNPSF